MSRIRPENLVPDPSHRSVGADIFLRQEPEEEEDDEEDEDNGKDDREDDDEENEDGYSE